MSKITIGGFKFSSSSFWTGYRIKNIESTRFPPILTSKPSPAIHKRILAGGNLVDDIDYGIALSRRHYSRMFSRQARRAFELGLVQRRNATQIRVKNGQLYFTGPRLKSSNVNILCEIESYPAIFANKEFFFHERARSKDGLTKQSKFRQDQVTCGQSPFVASEQINSDLQYAAGAMEEPYVCRKEEGCKLFT